MLFQDMEFVKYTNTTITSLDELKIQLQKIRIDGHAIDNGEFHPSIFCISTPIFSNTGAVNAAISVTSMINILDERKIKFLEVLKETSKRISSSLGYKTTVQ